MNSVQAGGLIVQEKPEGKADWGAAFLRLALAFLACAAAAFLFSGGGIHGAFPSYLSYLLYMVPFAPLAMSLSASAGARILGCQSDFRETFCLMASASAPINAALFLLWIMLSATPFAAFPLALYAAANLAILYLVLRSIYRMSRVEAALGAFFFGIPGAAAALLVFALVIYAVLQAAA